MRLGSRDSNGILEIDSMGGWLPTPLLPTTPSLSSLLFTLLLSLYLLLLLSLYLFLLLSQINSLQPKKGKQAVQILSQALAGRQAVFWKVFT